MAPGPQIPRSPSNPPLPPKDGALGRRSASVVGPSGDTISKPAAEGKSHFRQFYLKVCRPVIVFALIKAHDLFKRSDKVTRLTDRAVGVLRGLSPEQQQRLDTWVNSGGEGARAARQEAAARIQQCFNKGSYHLNLDALDLTELPDLIGDISWLKQLSCYSNQLTRLPESLSRLHNLRQLECGRNKLTELPEPVLHLHRLERLGISNNQLTSLPPDLGGLKYLHDLNLNFNQMTAIPAALAELSQHNPLYIRKVHLNGNQIKGSEIKLWERKQSIYGVVLNPSLRIARGDMSGMPLEQKVAHWFDLAGEPMPDNLLRRFQREDVKTALNVFMEKLVPHQ